MYRVIINDSFLVRIAILFGTLLNIINVGKATELAQARDPSVQLAVESFRAALKQSQQDCEFACNYRWVRWFPEDIDDAMTSEVPAKVGESYSGVFNRRKNLWRISRNPDQSPPDGPADNSADNRGMTTLSGPIPTDQLFNNDVYFEYNAPWGGHFDSGALTPFSQNPDILNNGGCVSNAQHLSPLNALPGCNRDVFCADTKEVHAYQVEFDVMPADIEHVIVKTKWSLQLDGIDYSQICETSIWTVPRNPVIDSITVTWTVLNRLTIKEQQIEKVALRDFRQCGNYQIAANVRHVFHTRGFKNMYATDWTSSDLGRRTPIDDDFEVKITPRSRIFGLKASGNDKTIERIGPAFLTTERARPDGAVITQKPVVVPASRIQVWWVAIAFLPLVGWCVYYWSRNP